MNGALLMVTLDREFAQRLEGHLHRCRIGCSVSYGADSGVDDSAIRAADALLLDLDMASSPATLVRSVRASAGCRVLLTCSWKEAGIDLILAYEAGADDYFAKSTDLMLVEAKVRRALRRRDCQASGQHPTNGHELGTTSRQELLQRLDSDLTRFEFRLLKLLTDETGPLVPKHEIIQQLWGRSTTDPKLLYEHISTLRSKLQQRGWTVANVRGQGYRLEPFDIRPVEERFSTIKNRGGASTH